MFLCEAFLMATLTLLGIYVTYTDIKNGIIQNKVLIVAAVTGVIINVIYLGVYCRDFVLGFFTNLAFISLLAVLLYGFHFWAAGDSKLLICATILFPARFYDNNELMFAPGVRAIVIIFLIAYLYIIADSVIRFIKKDTFFAGKPLKLSNLKSFVINYLICLLYLRGIGEILRYSLKDIYSNNIILFSFINVFIAMLIHENSFFRKWYALVPACIVNLIFLRNYNIRTPYIYGYVILLIALGLRYLLNGYNYQEINTSNVEEGMVLSYATIIQFMPSRINGLPQKTYEDIRSRISADEVSAIKRWEKSKYGKEKITIVRKIPFAIFIVMGELFFFFININGLSLTWIK